MNWISIDERMPEKCTSVLVCFENSCRDDLMVVAWFDRGLWWLNPKHALDRNYERVTYWMPLPEAPGNLTTHAQPTGGTYPRPEPIDDPIIIGKDPASA